MMLERPRVTHRLTLVVIIPTSSEDVLMYIGNHGVGVHSQLSLERGRLATIKQEHTERTLKTCKTLLRSDFQAAITSLSFLA